MVVLKTHIGLRRALGLTVDSLNDPKNVNHLGALRSALAALPGGTAADDSGGTASITWEQFVRFFSAVPQYVGQDRRDTLSDLAPAAMRSAMEEAIVISRVVGVVQQMRDYARCKTAHNSLSLIHI